MKAIFIYLYLTSIPIIVCAQKPLNYIVIEKDLGNSDRFIPAIIFYYDSKLAENDKHWQMAFCNPLYPESDCLPKFFLLDSMEYLKLSLGIPKLELVQTNDVNAQATIITMYANGIRTYKYSVFNNRYYSVYSTGLFKIIDNFNISHNKKYRLNWYRSY